MPKNTTTTASKAKSATTKAASKAAAPKAAPKAAAPKAAPKAPKAPTLEEQVKDLKDKLAKTERKLNDLIFVLHREMKDDGRPGISNKIEKIGLLD